MILQNLKNTRSKFNINTLSIVSVLGVLATIVPLTFVQAKTLNEDNTAKLILNKKSEKILSLSASKPEIKPGESVVQKQEREAREAAEAAARAKAEAEAQAEAARVAASNAKRTTVARGGRTNTVSTPVGEDVYVRAQNAYGVDWRILKAVHYVETGCDGLATGSSTKTNKSGARGPMQFIPSTWARYGVDGNGDGQADIYNTQDAIFSAANYLRACGYPNIQKALWGYNPSSAYYNKVMDVARSLGF